jgi:hypothetical protein
LDIINLREPTGTTKGLIPKVTVSGGIHLQNKVREIDKHTMAVNAKEPTAALTLMGPKAVERVPEVRNV